MSRITALIDANVLIPHNLGDLLMSTAWTRAYIPVISESVLQEVLRNQPEAHNRVQAIRRSFPDRVINENEFQHIDVTFPENQKDKHVVQAAVYAGSQFLVTADTALMSQVQKRSDLDIAGVYPYEFLFALATSVPSSISRAMNEIARRSSPTGVRTVEFQIQQIRDSDLPWSKELAEILARL